MRLSKHIARTGVQLIPLLDHTMGMLVKAARVFASKRNRSQRPIEEKRGGGALGSHRLRTSK